MSKVLKYISIFPVVFSISHCGSTQPEKKAEPAPQTEPSNSEDKKVPPSTNQNLPEPQANPDKSPARTEVRNEPVPKPGEDQKIETNAKLSDQKLKKILAKALSYYSELEIYQRVVRKLGEESEHSVTHYDDIDWDHVALIDQFSKRGYERCLVGDAIIANTKCDDWVREKYSGHLKIAQLQIYSSFGISASYAAITAAAGAAVKGASAAVTLVKGAMMASDVYSTSSNIVTIIGYQFENKDSLSDYEMESIHQTTTDAILEKLTDQEKFALRMALDQSAVNVLRSERQQTYIHHYNNRFQYWNSELPTVDYFTDGVQSLYKSLLGSSNLTSDEIRADNVTGLAECEAEEKVLNEWHNDAVQLKIARTTLKDRITQVQAEISNLYECSVHFTSAECDLLIEGL